MRMMISPPPVGPERSLLIVEYMGKKLVVSCFQRFWFEFMHACCKNIFRVEKGKNFLQAKPETIKVEMVQAKIWV